MKVVVTGKNGQLASELELLKSNSENWNFFDKNNLDISNINSLSNYFSINKTDVIINCAAYTKVDNAENFCDKAFQVNHVGVKNLIYVCQKFNIKLIHISTDYVFDGNSKVPYNENDKRNPINVYGQSKLLGENEILNSIHDRNYSFFFQNTISTFVFSGTTDCRQRGQIGFFFSQVSTQAL